VCVACVCVCVYVSEGEGAGLLAGSGILLEEDDMDGWAVCVCV